MRFFPSIIFIIHQAVATGENWSEDSLKAAIIELKNSEMSVYAAARTYGISKKTLEMRSKINEKYLLDQVLYSAIVMKINFQIASSILILQSKSQKVFP